MTDADQIFAALKQIYAPYAGDAVTVVDAPGTYHLATHEVRKKDGYRTGFGGVEINKSYVSAHLIPVYVHPDLLSAISPALKKRMQGKSCFNFKKLDPSLFGEFAQLVAAGYERFKQDGRL